MIASPATFRALALLLAAGCLLPLLALTGCSSNPWTYNAPPTTVEPSPATRAERRTVVVVGEFADPTGPSAYPAGVGRFVSEAFSRALLNDGKYDVWINPQLSAAVEQIVNRPAFYASSSRSAQLASLHLGNEEVHYVILGKVTDFHHTGELPKDASRWGVFGRRNDAIVAIDLRIVDMRTRRVVGADHVTAAVRAGRTSTEELYSGITLDSYMFWNTPLGRACKQAMQRATERTDIVIPPPLLDPQIHGTIAWRRVSIIGGSLAGLVPGQELYVLSPTAHEARYTPVRDADTDKPLRVRIQTVTRENATGWLLGERPANLSLRGAILAKELPTSAQPRLPATDESTSEPRLANVVPDASQER